MKKKNQEREENLQRSINNYWDKRSRAFAEVRRRELQSGDADRWFAYVSARLPKIRGAKILDIGTGAGFFPVLLGRAGGIVTGIDMSPKMLDEAKKNAELFNVRAEFLLMNAQKLDFPDESFDVLVSRQLTWTLPDAMEAYREWLRVLKIGGVLLNFDSDCGKVTFTQKKDAKDVHAGIDPVLIDECNAIKNELRITEHTRPEWDTDLLTKLGARVTVEGDVAKILWQDENILHDDLPLFAICAVKKG